MKERIKKLRSRRGKFDSSSKICKNCGKDYVEKENFNWSCRTHRGEFSGEMWWCCGKEGKDQPGCLYAKHESKDEEDEEEDDKERERAEAEAKLKQRCMCCKEVGHLIDNCPRDPNIKTKVEPSLDFERIQRIKDYRKLFADTAVLTTHMLKKCVLIPYKMEDKEEDGYQKHPFKRGAMKFDDFNYAMYNPFILVEDTNNTGP